MKIILPITLSLSLSSIPVIAQNNSNEPISRDDAKEEIKEKCLDCCSNTREKFQDVLMLDEERCEKLCAEFTEEIIEGWTG